MTEYYYCRLFSVKTSAKELDGFAGIGKKSSDSGQDEVPKKKFQMRAADNNTDESTVEDYNKNVA